MSSVLYVLGVLVFAVGLLGSIALHEVGHMVPAKKFGVKVTQYMVGFGRTLWSRTSGDTQYGIKAIPLGGYIRMIGMVPPRADGSVSRWPRRMATAIEDFRQMSRSEVGPGDENREFYRLTPGKKIIVMAGGPSMNLLIYLVLTLILLTTLGQVHDDPTPKVNAITQCVVSATAPEAAQTDCTGLPASPAAAAGLRPGDRIAAVNGRPVTAWQQVVTVVEASPNRTVSLTIVRAGTTQTLAITPVTNTKCRDVDCKQTYQAGFIGVEPFIHHYYKAVPVLAVPRQVADQIGAGLSTIGHYPSKIVNLFQTVFEGKKRDPAGAVGIVGIGRLSGDFAKSKVLDLQDKIATLVSLLAGVNLLLFFFNLLPLLPLDGGHVAGAITEAVKRGRAKRRARRSGSVATEPEIYVDTAQMLPVMYGVGSLLLVLTLLTLYADIVHPISLNG